MLPRKLEYLIALAQEGHFARAAVVCHVSQPALSVGIHQLEQELGVQIVKRGQRFRGFTEQGELVLAWAQRMQVESNRLRQQLRDRGDRAAGTLRIGLLISTAPFVSIFTIPFQQRFPEVNLKVMNHNPFEIHQGLEEFEFDVVISYLDANPKGYRFSHFLYTQEYYLLTRRGSRFSRQTPATWEEVKRFPLCLYPSETQVFTSDVYETLGDAPRGVQRLETDAMPILMDHVRTGNWASILPKPVLFLIAGTDEFEAIPLPLTPEAGHIGIAVPHRQPECQLAEEFFQIATGVEALKRFHELFDPSIGPRSRRHDGPTHQPP